MIHRLSSLHELPCGCYLKVGSWWFCPTHAAAPDLYAAAKALLAEEPNLTTAAPAEYLAYRALEAAVAKAEGR